jgi:rubrerythrin
MTTSDLLENCIQIERTIGQIYGIFKEQQAGCPEYADLWEKTAREEHNHEQQFILAQRLACSLRTIHISQPHPSRDFVKTLSDLKVRVAETSLSPSESIRLALGIEERLAAFHLDQMRVFSEEPLNQLFRSMMDNDKGHIEDLKRAFLNCCVGQTTGPGNQK